MLRGIAKSPGHHRSGHFSNALQLAEFLQGFEGTIRVSVGIEDIEDLKEDFEQAIQKMDS